MRLLLPISVLAALLSGSGAVRLGASVGDARTQRVDVASDLADAEQATGLDRPTVTTFVEGGATDDEEAAAMEARRRDMALEATHDLGSGAVQGAMAQTLLGHALRETNGGTFTVSGSTDDRDAWEAMHPVMLSVGNATQAAADFTKHALANRPMPLAPRKDLVPLLRFYKDEPGQRDHILTTNPYEFAGRETEYSFQGIVSFIWGRRRAIATNDDQPDPNLVPFWRFWVQQGNAHYFSTKVAGRSSSDIRQGVAGFLYKTHRDGLVQLREFYNGANNDYMYSVSNKSKLSTPDGDYQFTRVLGFVQPLVHITPEQAAKAAAKEQAEKNAVGSTKEAETAEKAANPTEDLTKKSSELAPPPVPRMKNKPANWHPGMAIPVRGMDLSK